MKKIIPLLALVILIMSPASCSQAGPSVPADTPLPPDSPSPPVSPPALAEPTGQPGEDWNNYPLVAPGAGFDFGDPEPPVFTGASVHDPSVFRFGGWFYVIGSHLASAKTEDLMRWTQISTGPQKGNKLVPDPRSEFAEALTYAKTDTFWAGDIHAMPDGRFLMYYCVCVGNAPLGAIGLAVSEDPEGPYTDRGMFIKSGISAPDGGRYDATVHPNAIDPQAFFDNDGNFWMVYGSYSGGIFIVSMDPDTGLPYPGQENRGYGRKLLGGNHSRIEGAYIIYSPESGYYYLFLTFGGLDSAGGYNIRVCRSQNPDGPYEDAAGQDMLGCKGGRGSFFDDRAIEPYGVKLMGGYQFRHEEGEPGRTTGYLSPGHNSAYYDAETGRYFLLFHTRFTNRGEAHEIRVHEMFINAGGWPVVSPFRYDGGAARSFEPEQLSGSWKLIKHGRDINTKAKISNTALFMPGGVIAGGPEGVWRLGDDGKTAEITIDGETYTGVFLRCWDQDNGMWVQAFTALSAGGEALWGAGAALGAGDP